MSSARRPLLTATAAGTLLGALWFVPSANASQDTPAGTEPVTQVTTQARTASTTTNTTTTETAAHTTSTDTITGTATDTTTGTTTDTTTDVTAEQAVRTLSDDGVRLADTGSFDTTPYVVGGTALLVLGAGFVAYSIRRERLGF